MRILAMTTIFPSPYFPIRAPYNAHRLCMLAETHVLRVIAPISWIEELAARRRGLPPLPKSRQVAFKNLRVDHPRYYHTPKLMRSMYGQFYRWSVRSTFVRVVAELKPDLVYAPWAYPDGWAAVHLARRAGLPVVLRIHGSDVMLVDHYRGRGQGTRFALREADGVIAVSQELANRAIKLGAAPERVKVIIDGVNTSVFKPGDKRAAQARLGMSADMRHFLFVGNLVEVKGIDVLLKACAQFPALLGDWRLHLVGEGQLKWPLQQLALALKLNERVIFHGSKVQEQLSDWYRAADVFVLPSRSEGLPSVLLEAANCGTPWVASRVGGIPEIAQAGAERLVDPDNPAQLAQAIVDIVFQPTMGARYISRDQREAADEAAEFMEMTWRNYVGQNDVLALGIK